MRRAHRAASKLSHPRHRGKLLYLFLANVTLAFLWGPVFITLTLLGPLRHLSSEVVWVAMISYYANMMGNTATAAALYSSIVAHRASAVATDASEIASDTAEGLVEHEMQTGAAITVEPPNGSPGVD
jgi:hypothetical protein